MREDICLGTILYHAGFDAWVMLIHARDKNDVHCNIATLYIAPRFPEHRKFCVGAPGDILVQNSIIMIKK